MYTLKLNLVVILSFLLHKCYCQRRIVNGENVSEPKRYVVYLIEARISPMEYDEWMCGGALVTPEFIVTSAACIEDVKHLYAIAGYDKYVPKDEIHKDVCTSTMKKKIVLTCVPKSYELEYANLEKWSFIDIGVAKVESPYDLEDKQFETLCSYMPKLININFEIKYQIEGVDAIVLGWGHKNKWRTDGDTKTYNNVMLQYTPVLLANKEKCKKEYEQYPGMGKVIDTYMICSIEAGNIDSKGTLRTKRKPKANGCPGYEEKIEKLLALQEKSEECDPAVEAEDMSWLEYTRRKTSDNDTTNNDKSIYNSTNNLENETDDAPTNFKPIRIMNTRRNGICQNDHGGPIVTWIGSEEYLIGVASVFKVSKDMDCTPPYLYTSTECNGAFLACVLDLDKNEAARRAICNAPPSVKGFDTIETHISWKYHPDGLADNERNVSGNLINATSTLSNIRPSDSTLSNSSLINVLTTLAAKRIKEKTKISYRSSDDELLNSSKSLTNATTTVSTIKIIQNTESRVLSSERVNASLETITTSLFTKKINDSLVYFLGFILLDAKNHFWHVFRKLLLSQSAA